MSPKSASNGPSPTGLDRQARSLREWAERVRGSLTETGDLIFLHHYHLDASLLAEIEEALGRLDDGTYGICQECRERIAARRLESAPWTKFCHRCHDVLRAMAAHTRGDA